MLIALSKYTTILLSALFLLVSPALPLDSTTPDVPLPETGTVSTAPVTPAATSRGYRWSDQRAGVLRNPKRVPCGGLWDYRFAGRKGTFYAREIACSGSHRYLSLKKGQRVILAGKKCRVVGTQALNYRKHNTNHIRWMGNTIVQTCTGSGNVRLVNFNCS